MNTAIINRLKDGPVNKKISIILVLFLLLTMQYFSCSSSPSTDQNAQETQKLPYYTGDGGKGIKLAVLEPTGKGLSPNEQWMLSLVQGSITGDFNKYSAMTIIDRQNLEKILAEQTQSLSGDYSDEDYISIGKLTNARYILTGSISKISGNYMLELSVSDVESSERKASYPPRQVTFAVLEDLTAVKEASADLLGQLGVSLTAAGLTELTKAVAPIQVQAETALARGITAQKQGTEVAALSYYFQAATLDPSLLEAANRSSVLTANINSGNIAQDVRNDIQWRRDWINRLTETEKFFADLFQNTAMVYTLFYSTGIEQGAHDYENETATFNINTNLHASQLWAASVERALQTVYDGLDATKRKAAWGLGNWPRQSVSGLKPFDTMYNMFAVTIDLLNDRNQVIGIKTFVAGGAWTFNVTDRPAMGVVEDDKQTISIAGININDITDNLKIRIADVKGYSIQTVDESGKPVFTEADMESLARTQTEGQPGVLQIKEVSGEEWEFYSYFTFVKGSIVGYNNYTYDKLLATYFRSMSTQEFDNLTDRFRSLTVPGTIWGDPVIAIGDEAFLNASELRNIIISDGVTTIGRKAFYKNYLYSVIIPDSVKKIGQDAFYNISKITIGNGVRLAHFSYTDYSNFDKFCTFYNRKKIGLEYTL